jgi:hypothetical protein
VPGYETAALFGTEYRHVHHRAAALYDRAAAHAPGNIVVIDRRQLDTSGAISLMQTQITESNRHSCADYAESAVFSY